MNISESGVEPLTIEELRKKKSVLMVPGSQFGEEMKSYFRVGFGSHDDHLRQALAKMDELLSR